MIKQLPGVQTLPKYPSQGSFGNFLGPATCLHLPLTSQGVPILGTASSASEVNRHPVTPLFDIMIVTSLWVWVWFPY